MEPSLAARLRALRAKVAEEKRIIRQAKARLADTATELRTLEDDCRRRGIQLVIVPAERTVSGVGAIHGRSDDPDSRSHH